MTTMRRFLALAILILLLAACGRDKTEEPTAVPPAAEAAATATTAPAEATAVPEATTAPEAAQAAAPSGEPHEVVMNAMRAQLAGGPYRATSTIDSAGTITEMTAEVIPPDTMHVKIGGGNLELIMVDGTLWSKSPDAPWVQMGGADSMQGILDSIRGQIDDSMVSNVQLVGSEPVYGEATDVYSFTSILGEGDTAVTSDTKLWISKTTGLPVRMEATSNAGGVATHTIQTIEYDDTITIEAPTP
jgi:hypothetical protein